MTSWEDMWAERNRAEERRLREHDAGFVLDFSRNPVRGALPNGNLAPINLGTGDLTINQLGLGKGGTGADLEGSLAGVVQILNDGDPAMAVTALDSGFIDWNDFPGAPSSGEVLKFTGSGAGADFGPLDFATAASHTGTLNAAHGGTGQSSYAVGDLLYASASATLSKLADVATGNALISGGVTTAPAWGKIGLTTHVSGVLGGTNGGTGVNNGARTLTVNTNSGTIDFGAAGLTLTYNEGTYTPTYQGLTTGGATTYTTQQGAWIRVGRIVIATGAVVWTAASGTGIAIVSLPFTAANVAGQFYAGVTSVTGVTFANGAPNAQVAPNTAYFFLVSPLTNAAPGTPAVEAAGNIVFTIVYFV